MVLSWGTVLPLLSRTARRLMVSTIVTARPRDVTHLSGDWLTLVMVTTPALVTLKQLPGQQSQTSPSPTTLMRRRGLEQAGETSTMMTTTTRPAEGSTTPLLMLMTRSMMGMMELMTTLTSLSLHHSLTWRILTRVTDTSMTGDPETTGHQPSTDPIILPVCQAPVTSPLMMMLRMTRDQARAAQPAEWYQCGGASLSWWCQWYSSQRYWPGPDHNSSSPTLSSSWSSSAVSCVSVKYFLAVTQHW